MSDDWYDTAQICTNGHVINWMSVSKPEYNRRFCDKCGAQAITNCQYCNAIIRGYYHKGRFTMEKYERRIREALDAIPDPMLDYNTTLTLPSYCPDCGKPYPWTEAKLKAARELTDLLEELSSEEREALKKSFDDIVRDTPQTKVAATQFKRLIAKVGKIAAEQLRELVVDIASETAKKIILEQGEF